MPPMMAAAKPRHGGARADLHADHWSQYGTSDRPQQVARIKDRLAMRSASMPSEAAARRFTATALLPSFLDDAVALQRIDIECGAVRLDEVRRAKSGVPGFHSPPGAICLDQRIGTCGC